MQETKPIEPVQLSTAAGFTGELRHVVDNRTPDMKLTRGDGVTYIQYGDDTLAPLPIQILDSEIDARLGGRLRDEKVVILKFTVALKPVIGTSTIAPGLAGVSVPLAIAVETAETTAAGEHYECDIQGTVGNRGWWVNHDIPPSGKGISADIENLLMQCIAVAITRIAAEIQPPAGARTADTP